MNSPEITRVPQYARIGDESFPLPEPPEGLELSNPHHVTYLLRVARSKFHQEPVPDWEVSEAYAKIGPSKFSTLRKIVHLYLDETPHLNDYLATLFETRQLSKTGRAISSVQPFESFAEQEEKSRYRIAPEDLPSLSTGNRVHRAIKGSGMQKEPGPTFRLRDQVKGKSVR